MANCDALVVIAIAQREQTFCVERFEYSVSNREYQGVTAQVLQRCYKLVGRFCRQANEQATGWVACSFFCIRLARGKMPGAVWFGLGLSAVGLPGSDEAM